MVAIAVLGAKGRVGHAAARAFLNHGYDVIAVTRDGVLPAGLEGAIARGADAMNREAVIEATRGADIIFNGLNPLYPDWPKRAMPMARNAIAAAKAHGATHLFPGNVYNYGREIPPVASDTTPFFPTTRKGAIRIEMEKLFAEAAESDGVQTLILRAGDFYGGTGTGSWFDIMIAAKLAKGTFTWPGPTALDHAWAYLPDLAEGFVALAEKRGELPAFDQFTFAGHTLSGDAMRAHVEAILGRKLKRAGVPWLALRAGGLFVPMWREVHEMSYLWFTPHRLDDAKFQAAAGPFAYTPERDAIRTALAELNLLGSGKVAA